MDESLVIIVIAICILGIIFWCIYMSKQIKKEVRHQASEQFQEIISEQIQASTSRQKKIHKAPRVNLPTIHEEMTPKDQKVVYKPQPIKIEAEFSQHYPDITLKKVCCICWDKRPETALFPCGHAKFCDLCAQQCKKCPICRVNVESRKRIFM
uniref:RING-type domain-containing protein n=1 Tax=Acrobeloides nanus TaxID=290746 RepID=A0A914D788_9BILA